MGSEHDGGGRIIIHVDMDAFYASVEVRDDPSLRGKPLIIGALPRERGVVSTCSYEARKYGVHSAMNIKEAYSLCPHGVFKHPNFAKYKAVSDQVHEIWASYTDIIEYIALDEAYLDVTETAGDFEEAGAMARAIKYRVREEVGLTCSVGVAYSMAAAKTASEERKPDGYFEIRTPNDFVNLVIDREVRVIPGVGARTAKALRDIDIITVRDLTEREDEAESLLGNHGRDIVELAYGIDRRAVTVYRPEDAKSHSREITLQSNVSDFSFLRDVILLLSFSVEARAREVGFHGGGVTLKITYADMESITRSEKTDKADSVYGIYTTAVELLGGVEKRPVRLIGVGVYGNAAPGPKQITLDAAASGDSSEEERAFMEKSLARLCRRYRLDIAGTSDFTGLESLHKTVERMRLMWSTF